MNDSMQLDLLRNHFSKFRDEYDNRSRGAAAWPANRPFRWHRRLVAYCMVRHFQPRLIIEVGSGFSSLVLGQAAAKNKNSALICIDPFPRDLLRKGFPGLQSLIEKKVQDIDWNFFHNSSSGDILVHRQLSYGENWRRRQLSFPGSIAASQAGSHRARPRYLFALRLSARLGAG